MCMCYILLQVGHNDLPPENRRPSRLQSLESSTAELCRIPSTRRVNPRRSPKCRVHRSLPPTGVARSWHSMGHATLGHLRQRTWPWLLRHSLGTHPRSPPDPPHVTISSTTDLLLIFVLNLDMNGSKGWVWNGMPCRPSLTWCSTWEGSNLLQPPSTAGIWVRRSAVETSAIPTDWTCLSLWHLLWVWILEHQWLSGRTRLWWKSTSQCCTVSKQKAWR